MKIPILLTNSFFALISNLLTADVLSWRNNGSGEFEKIKPPLDWSDEKSTLWSAKFDESNASPILVGEKLLFTEEPSSLVCVDSQTGETIWKRDNGLLSLLGLNAEEIEKANATMAESDRLDKEIARKLYEMERLGRSEPSREEKQKKQGEIMQQYLDLGKEKESLSANDPYGDTVTPASHPSNGYSSYTPVSDGTHVFVCFGSGSVIAYDMEGNRVWHKILDDTDHIFGGSVSPILVDGKLIVRFADYVALDPASGNELWRTPSNVNFGTPIEFRLENQSFLFTSRGEVIRVSDGKKITEELVEITNEQMDWTVFNSPVWNRNQLYTVRGINGQEGHAYRFQIPDSVHKLESDGLELVWRKDVRKGRYYASPLLLQGLLYVYSDNSWLSVLEAESGEIIYEHRIEGMSGITYPSLVLAGDNIFAGSENGHATFFQPGRTYEEVARTEIPPYRSTPIFVGDKVYLRTREDIRAIQ